MGRTSAGCKELGTRESEHRGRVFCILLPFCLLSSAFCLLPSPATAESAESLVSTGNAFYAAGEYDKALESYEKALTEEPDAGEVLFNKGNVYFKQGEYDKAREAYKAAALHTRDLTLEAFAHYNLGNAVFAEGQKGLESDPRKSLTQWGQSIQHYQEALRIDPQFKEAAQNVEVVRLALKELADRIKKAEEAAREQQKQREELKKELEEVIREQQSELSRNDALQEKAAEASGESLKRDAQELAADQEKTHRKTGDIADKLKAMQGQQQTSLQQPDSQPSTPEDHLEKAREAQQSAVEKLEKTELAQARQDQDEALQHLKAALTPPDSKDGQGQCQNPQAGDQSGKEEEQNNKEGEKTSPQDPAAEEPGKDSKPAQQQTAEERSQAETKESGEKGDEQKTGALFSESPENILREEKENRLQLQRAQQGAYKPVDKDW